MVQIDMTRNSNQGNWRRSTLGDKDRQTVQFLRNCCEKDEGYFVATMIMSNHVPTLIDTGANITILSKQIFDDWNPSCKPEIEPVKMNMLTATGEKSPFHGKVKLNIQIGKCSYDHEFLLAEIKDNGILGMDFLTKNKCDLMLSKGYMMLYKERIPCFSDYGDTENTCCRISLNDNVIIPPESKMMVSGKTIDVIPMNLSGIVEPDKNFIEKTGILIAKAADNLNNGLIPMRLINVSEKPYKLYENTVIANFEVIDKIEMPCGNVRTSRTQEVLEGVDQLPELLKNLYDESSKELLNEQQVKLQELLIKHNNVFSKTSQDIGNTSIVEHTIDTGDAKPIKLRPYRIPLSKKLDAEEEIRKMAEIGIIEPSSSAWCQQNNTKLHLSHQKDWDEYLQPLMMAYRSSEHATTGVSPCKMMFGREVTMPLDLLIGRPKEESNDDINYSTYAKGLQEKVESIHSFARRRIYKSSD
ncbi:unnamed protein product [Mytilus coruscus]|uniref:Peptidase A2 domain-containing protein n=1 Tax=Mytilus coruscus TaxID=42192 RepID=A0A6J8F152_MYTCO|nr:unnamed protein product [Mytilus coruscus]